MMRCKIICFLFLFACQTQETVAQKTTVKTDSTKVYRDIEKFSKKRKVTNFLYQFFFKPVPTTSAPVQSKKSKAKKKPERKPYSYFEGKIIRNIFITALDPFGYSAEDTTVAVQNFLYKAGNSLHIRTLPITVRNLLLFRKNEPFDSLLVKESERLIRSQRYVHEVVFNPKLAKPNSDSVDIFIRVLDEWSIIPEGGVSTSLLKIKITENNFLGTGHRFENDFLWNYTNGKNSQRTNYYIPNITNTYINSNFQHYSDENKNTIQSISVERPFFSSYAKWAAGAYFVWQFRRDSILLPDSTRKLQNFRSGTEDYWAGKAWQIFRGNSEDNRSTNLILTTRFIRNHYSEKPDELYDSLHAYSSENFYLAGVGISTRKYVQDKYVFNYGVTEDVPVGRAYGLVGGYRIKNNIGRWYMGMRFSKGNYYDWGYLSTSVEYGTNIHSSNFEQGTLSAGANYFTGLFEVGRWKFRQFVKPRITVGIHRLKGDMITLNTEGINGFNSDGLTGHHKAVLTLQTQAYSPWNVLGFQFGPYFRYSCGMLGTEKSGFKYSKLYSQFGLGVLIKNEFLVFGTFQVSFAYYPVIPGVGGNIVKYNPDKTSDIGFHDFSISKPGTIAYQ